MFYAVARFTVMLLFKICFRMKAFGRENFPKDGPVIVAPNHASFLDPVAVGISAPRVLNYMARDTLFRFRPFGKLLSMVNVFPLKREKGDVNAFRKALEQLKENKAILVFPEGTRSRDGNLQRPKDGIGFLSAMSGASIVPCYVKGSFKALPRGASFPRFEDVTVYFGKPVKFSADNSPADKKERYRIIASDVMKRIEELKKNAD